MPGFAALNRNIVTMPSLAKSAGIGAAGKKNVVADKMRSNVCACSAGRVLQSLSDRNNLAIDGGLRGLSDQRTIAVGLVFYSFN